MYNRVLRPALRDAGIAVKVGVDERDRERWEYQGVALHAFRKACGSLLLAQGGKNLKQVQGWLRHARLSTTLDVYLHEVDAGLAGAEAWDEMLPWGQSGAIDGPGPAANEDPGGALDSALEHEIGD